MTPHSLVVGHECRAKDDATLLFPKRAGGGGGGGGGGGAGGGSNVPSSSSSRTGGRTCTHPGVDEEGPREPVRRHWKMTMEKINTSTLPPCAASFTCSPFTY